ncbi:MAG: heavy metal-binding domain-containing protein [Bacteroidales bacterium]|nr:heavy metal-binding domain-containing protein [Bacteroidales bacterium]
MDFIVTTTPNIEGYAIEEYCGIVLDNSFNQYEENTRKSLSDIIEKAKRLGANAIVGLKIVTASYVHGDYGCSTDIEFSAYGTAVRVTQK